MTTGSSIMPQKRNPDVLELLRGRSARMRARLSELEWVCGKLPSSYHRDLQLTKEPAMRAAFDLRDMLTVATAVVGGFEIAADRLAAAMRPELYATHAALALVREGAAFRDAYRQIAEQVKAGTFDSGAANTEAGKSPMVATALIDTLKAELNELAKRADSLRSGIEAAEAGLLE
jgi:argininosuccinate lyase